MNELEFKNFYQRTKNKLNAYIIEVVSSSSISNEMIPHIYARFYRTKSFKPENLSPEQFLLIITKKYLIEYLTWRMSEEAQTLPVEGISAFHASKKLEEETATLDFWLMNLDETFRKNITENVLGDLPPADVRFDLKEAVKEKLSEIGKKYGKK